MVVDTVSVVDVPFGALWLCWVVGWVSLMPSITERGERSADGDGGPRWDLPDGSPPARGLPFGF